MPSWKQSGEREQQQTVDNRRNSSRRITRTGRTTMMHLDPNVDLSGRELWTLTHAELLLGAALAR